MLFHEKKIISLLNNTKGIQVVEKNKKKGEIVVEWAGRKFIVKVYDRDYDDQLYIYNTQFSVTIAFGGDHTFKKNTPLVDKYKIMNLTNIQSNDTAFVALRDSVDIFQITARHVLFMRGDDLKMFSDEHFLNQYIIGSILGLMLTCVTKLGSLQDNIKKYNEDSQHFRTDMESVL